MMAVKERNVPASVLASLALLVLAGFLLGPCSASAQESTPVDELFDQFLQLEPSVLAERLKTLKSEAGALDAESAALRKQADELEKRVAEIQQRLEPFIATLRALLEAEGLLPKPAPAENMTPSAMTPQEENNLTFAEHIVPVLEERCMRCHNEDKQKGGFQMDSFAMFMEGGGSGEVIAPGRPESSRLFRMINGQEDPNMPKKGDPLAPEDIELIRRWILEGARENSGSPALAVAAAEQPAAGRVIVPTTFDGTPPMPGERLPAARPWPVNRPVVARAMAASPTAPLLALAGIRQILLFDSGSFHSLGALPFPEGEIYTLSFSLDGELLLAGGGAPGDAGTAALYSVREAKRLGTYGAFYDVVLAAALSPGMTRLAVGGPNKAVYVYRVDSGALLYKIGDHSDWIYAIQFSPDNELLATADRAGGLLLWQAANGRPVQRLSGHTGPIHELSFTPDSNVLASAGGDGNVFLWDTWKFSEIKRFAAHPGGVLSARFGQAGNLVTSGADGATKKWDRQGALLQTFESLSEWAYQTCFTQNEGAVVTGNWLGEVTAWNPESGERLAAFSTRPEVEVEVARAGGGL